MDEYDTLQLSCDADEEFSRELSLRYAICLAENDEIQNAITYVRDALRTSEFHSNSQMLHLLSLLTSSTGDDTQVCTYIRIFVRIFVCFWRDYCTYMYLCKAVTINAQINRWYSVLLSTIKHYISAHLTSTVSTWQLMYMWWHVKTSTLTWHDMTWHVNTKIGCILTHLHTH